MSRNKPIQLVQEGYSSVIVHDPSTRTVVLIELCDLPRIISKLQEIHARMETPHSPDITGICTVCGNECVTNVDDDGNAL